MRYNEDWHAACNVIMRPASCGQEKANMNRINQRAPDVPDYLDFCLFDTLVAAVYRTEALRGIPLEYMALRLTLGTKVSSNLKL